MNQLNWRDIMKKLCFTFLFMLLSTPMFAANYQFVTFQYPPLEYENENSEVVGGAVSVVQLIMETLGHEVSIRVYPWTRALKMVQTGEADAIFTAYKTPEREQFLDYSEEVLFPQSIYFYKHKGSRADFDGDFSKLKDLRIGVLSTINYGKQFSEYQDVLNLDRASGLDQSFKKLIRDRVDLVPSERIVAEYTLEQLDIMDKVERLPVKLESLPSYIAFSKARQLTDLRNAFDEQLKMLKADGKYEEMLIKFSIESSR